MAALDVPIGQGAHAEGKAVVAYWSAAHEATRGVHIDAPAALAVPGAHAAHGPPDALKKLAGQSEEEVAPAEQGRERGQVLEPGRHGRQDVALLPGA